jgi:hypothetical protein
MSSNESKDKSRDHKASSEKASEREELTCLLQARLMMLRYKAHTVSAKKAEIAGLVAQAIAKLETLGEGAR